MNVKHVTLRYNERNKSAFCPRITSELIVVGIIIVLTDYKLTMVINSFA